MSRTKVAPHSRSLILRDSTQPRSRNGREGVTNNQLNVKEGGKMNLKEYAAGYAGLAGYTGLTQMLGINFFQLSGDHRAMWLAGAVCVLGAVTSRGWHSEGG